MEQEKPKVPPSHGYAVIAIAHGSVSYPSRGATPAILGLVHLIQRRLSGRMLVDERSAWLGILVEPLQI